MSRGRAANAPVDEIEQYLRAAAELIASRANAPAGSNAEVIARLDQILAKLGMATEYQVTWVKLEKYVELTGDSVDAVQARRKLGKWIDGKQCKIVDGRLWVNIPAVEDWIEQWDARAPAMALLASLRQRPKAKR